MHARFRAQILPCFPFLDNEWFHAHVLGPAWFCAHVLVGPGFLHAWFKANLWKPVFQCDQSFMCASGSVHPYLSAVVSVCAAFVSVHEGFCWRVLQHVHCSVQAGFSDRRVLCICVGMHPSLSEQKLQVHSGSACACFSACMFPWNHAHMFPRGKGLTWRWMLQMLVVVAETLTSGQK